MKFGRVICLTLDPQQCLEVSLKQLSGMLEVGDSVTHVDQLLAEAQDFHMLTAVSLAPFTVCHLGCVYTHKLVPCFTFLSFTFSFPS